MCDGRHAYVMQPFSQMATARASVVAPISAICKSIQWMYPPIQTFGTRSEFLKVVQHRRRPLLTISNHMSVWDDPFLFACMQYFNH